MVEQVLASYRMTIDQARQMLLDVADEQMSLRPAGLNPPAWILGHLVHSAQMMGGELNMQPWLPDRWVQLFETGSRPSEQSEYPAKAELLASLDDAMGRLARRLNEVGDEGMTLALPDEQCRQSMPTLGHAIVHILSGHASFHVGQLSAWRRAMGFTMSHGGS